MESGAYVLVTHWDILVHLYLELVHHSRLPCEVHVGKDEVGQSVGNDGDKHGA